MAVIDTLIDKQDTFEIIRDQIVAILVTESANQIVLATNAGKPEPNEWKLRVFKERSNPWEQFLNNPEDPSPDLSPIVNVWYSSSDFDKAKGNVVKRQAAEAIYNIDIYGFGISESDGATGQKPGDREAAIEVQKAIKLVRNILMAGQNTYLQLRGTVWGRWPQSITVFQPEELGQAVQQVVGARLALAVTFNEFSPQFTPSTLELLSVDVLRAEDGEIVVEADYDYTL